MKHKILLLIALLSIALISCEKLDLEVDVPRCIKKEIKSFSESKSGCTGAQVLRIYCGGDYVYQFAPGICIENGPVKFYDSKCSLICTTTGRDLFNSPCFTEQILDHCGNLVEVVWQKD